ncbi:MAG: methyltransferase, partial [Bdellovibrionota bacterium]
ANTQGAKGFLTRLKDLYPDLEAESEQKCRWAALPAPAAEARAVLEGWITEGQAGLVPDTAFHSVPGIYGWNKVDRGSIALATTLPALEGDGADLGSGYGYLSAVLLGLSPALSKLHVVEADSRALACARDNLAAWSKRCVFHWLDVTATETPSSIGGGSLDWVVMNPPFHEGTQVDQSVGKSFIETAAKLLKPDGKLFMVANSFLGYEELLMKRFRNVSRVLDQDGFKVIHAVR